MFETYETFTSMSTFAKCFVSYEIFMGHMRHGLRLGIKSPNVPLMGSQRAHLKPDMKKGNKGAPMEVTSRGLWRWTLLNRRAQAGQHTMSSRNSLSSDLRQIHIFRDRDIVMKIVRKVVKKEKRY